MEANESADGKVHEKGEHFTYSAEGADDFRKLILGEQLGMGEQGSMMIMSDVSDIAEESNHLNIMRMYTSKHGRLKRKDSKERLAEQTGEMGKMGDDRLTRNGNRLIFYNEVPDADYAITGKRASFITEAGLAYYTGNYQAIKNRVRRNEINASQALSAAQPQNIQKIFAAASTIENDGQRQQYLETMSALIDFGRTKLADASGRSRVDQVYDHFAAQEGVHRMPPRPQDRPIAAERRTTGNPPGYVPETIGPDGKPQGRPYMYAG